MTTSSPLSTKSINDGRGHFCKNVIQSCEGVLCRDLDLPELKNDLRKTNSHGRRLQEQSYAYRLFKNHKFCLKTISQFYNKDFMLLDYERLADFET